MRWVLSAGFKTWSAAAARAFCFLPIRAFTCCSSWLMRCSCRASCCFNAWICASSEAAVVHERSPWHTAGRVASRNSNARPVARNGKELGAIGRFRRACCANIRICFLCIVKPPATSFAEVGKFDRTITRGFLPGGKALRFLVALFPVELRWCRDVGDSGGSYPRRRRRCAAGSSLNWPKAGRPRGSCRSPGTARLGADSEGMMITRDGSRESRQNSRN